MQFHLNGFRTGDPAMSEPSTAHPALSGDSLPETVDVLIVGCGPAGLTLATQLSAFPDIKTLVVDQKAGPLELGQADGIACRTMEMFHAFGFSERVLKEAYWVNETTFWRPDDARPEMITRHGVVQDVEDGLSEFPHVILNQARVHDFYLETMLRSPSRMAPYYSRRLTDMQVEDEEGSPVAARFERLDKGHEGETETVSARYVVGCDGARSAVRRLLGRELRGDSANQAWGVMDVLAVTDFPDIRRKSLIQSTGEGSIVLIPREGDYLIRIYVELDKLSENERVANRNITVDHLVAATKRILNPYSFDVKEVAWWSVYEIGQRLCDKFDDVPDDKVAERLPRVFIAGDACHTHSPKAGQGMNVSMQDAFNLGWKLAAVLRSQTSPELLHSYSAERQAIAAELIDFDREWAKMLSAPLKSADHPDGVEPADVQDYFVRHGRYTAGTATRYRHSVISAEPTHQHLAKGLTIGMRLHSAPVIRLADAKPFELGHCAAADGRWRIYVFASSEDPSAAGSSIDALCKFLSGSQDSPLCKYTPEEADIDSLIDVHAVFQQGHRDLALKTLPAFLKPRKGRYGLIDHTKVFCPDPARGDIFDMRGVDRDHGCMVVVRPDQYVAHVLPIEAHADLAAFFDGFMLEANRRAVNELARETAAL